MIRRIRDLLYDQGFTISGARNRLQELAHPSREGATGSDESAMAQDAELPSMLVDNARDLSIVATGFSLDSNAVRQELFEIRALLSLN